MNPNENIEPLYAEASIESEDLTTSDVDICENEPEYKATSIEESLENVDTPPKEYDSTEVSECDILMSDYEELKAEFPELASLGDISKMEGAIRYGELRALGLTPREAYMATRRKPVSPVSSRAHLTPAAPGSARKSGAGMPRSELKIAREIFSGLSDSEIEALYKKVTRS